MFCGVVMMNEQIDIFNFIERPATDLACDDCVFDTICGCDHEETPEAYCVEGSFRVRRKQGRCPECGANLEIHQMDFGSDFGRCKRCGLQVIFNNQGNRLGWLEAWKQGLVAGE